MKGLNILHGGDLAAKSAVGDYRNGIGTIRDGKSLTGSPYRLFLRESFRSLRATASLCPSSRFLAAAMLDQVDFRQVRCLVELGPGTGVITREILRRMSPDARLFVLEINKNFVRHLSATFQDKRLTVLHADALDIARHLHEHDAGSSDAIVSSLGLTGMQPDQRTRIVQGLDACLSPTGILTQFQYLMSQVPFPDLPNQPVQRFQERQFLRSYFPNVSAKRVILNFPPAVVFTCRK